MKAILVIDMPKNCAECKLMYLQGIGEAICNAVDWEERPSWCPLKPMPKEQHAKWSWGDDDFQRGYNRCIDEILGDE